MELRCAKFTILHAKDVCTWKYEEEYAIYNYPKWEIASNENWAISVEEKRRREFIAVVDEKNSLCAYTRLQDKKEYILIGIGMKPSLCGQGLGKKLMEIVIKRCRTLYPDIMILLEVRSFNKRAISCYINSGFKVINKYEKITPLGKGEFIKMQLGGDI